MASNGKRQQRLEKRRRRKARQQQGWSVQLSGPALRGLRRMSDTIVDFAQPLLSRLPPGSGPSEWREELMIASIVWNGVLAEIPRATLVMELGQCVRGIDAGALVDELVARKQEQRFAADTRSVMGLDTYEDGNRIHVTALSAR